MINELKKIFSELCIGTKTMFKEFFKPETNKKQRANMLTFSRVIIPVVTLVLSFIFLKTKQVIFVIIAGILTLTGALTDYLDGKSSRKHNSASEYGKMLDQISDKIFAGIIAINLLFFNLTYIIILSGETLIAIINLYYKFRYKSLKMSSSKLGRIKEWPLFITLALGYFSTINNTWFIISTVSVIITFIIQVVTSIDYIHINHIKIKKMKNV